MLSSNAKAYPANNHWPLEIYTYFHTPAALPLAMLHSTLGSRDTKKEGERERVCVYVSGRIVIK